MAERTISTRIKLTGQNEFKRGMKQCADSVSFYNSIVDAAGGAWALAMQAAQGVFDGMKNLIGDAIDNSIQFESAMAGVAKTTDMNSTELTIFGQKLQALSTQIPTTANELAAIAEVAGQLGIKKDDLMAFTRVMADLGESTDLSATDAATAIARMANIMGTSSSEYERFGSSLVDLGNNYATTESEILDMATGIASTANLVGMTEADVLGLSAALSSTGLTAQAAGTSISTILQNIAKMVATGSGDLETYASLAGMSVQAFTEAWNNDATGTFQAIVNGMAGVAENGGSVITTLTDLGITDKRATRAMLNLVNANDTLNTSIETSSAAWNENTALADEAGKRYATTESKIAMMENSMTNLSASVGDTMTPAVADWSATINGVMTDLKKSIDVKAISKSIDQIDTTYNNSAQSIELARQQATSLIDTMDQLDAKGTTNWDDADLRSYSNALDLLQTIMPGVSSLINTETNSIEGGTAALRDYADAQYETSTSTNELARAKEKYDSYNAVRDLYGEAEKQAMLAQASLGMYYNNIDKLNDESKKAWEDAEAAAAAARENGQIADAKDYIDPRYKSDGTWDQDMVAAQDAAYGAEDAVNKLNKEMAKYGQIMADGEAAADTYLGLMEAQDEAAAAAATATGELSDADNKLINNVTLLSTTLDDLETQYLETLEATRAAVSDMFDGMSEMEMPEPKSLTEWTNGMQSQIDFMTQYSENLQKVQDLGVSGDLLTQLSDGSSESAAILQGIVDDEGASIDEYNAKAAEFAAAKEQMAQAMATGQTGIQAQTAEIVSSVDALVAGANQQGAASTSAAATVQGLIDGMNSKISSLNTKAATIKAIAASVANVSISGGTTNGSHAAGLGFVPFDNYVANLHRGEMVLTALEAKAYRASQFANAAMTARATGDTNTTIDYSRSASTSANTTNVKFGDVYVRSDADVKKISSQIAKNNKRYAYAKGR